MEAANTIYPENEYYPWEQIDVNGTDLSAIRKMSLFYYCRLDYLDSFNDSKSYNQDFYFVYDIDKQKLRHAMSKHKQQF
jgi:hypothetical protein